MKDLYKKGFAISMLVYFILVNSGICFSHIYCKKGERWIWGSTMPECKANSEEHKCPFTGKNCKNNEQKNNEDRKKDTYVFSFGYSGFAETSFELTHSNFSAFANKCTFIPAIDPWEKEIILSANRRLNANPPPLLVTNLAEFRLKVLRI